MILQSRTAQSTQSVKEFEIYFLAERLGVVRATNAEEAVMDFLYRNPVYACVSLRAELRW